MGIGLKKKKIDILLPEYLHFPVISDAPVVLVVYTKAQISSKQLVLQTFNVVSFISKYIR